MGVADPTAPLFANSVPREPFRVSLFALGSKVSTGAWTLPHVTPVFINDPTLQRHLFILGMTEQMSYGLFCPREGDGPAGGGMRGFHTSDHVLVLDLISQLQERYVLQRRIG
jgi:hypothetical protein